MTECKSGRSYPFKLRRKTCYHSPTSGRTRCGPNLTLHCDRKRNKEFTVNRKVGGGVKRTYDWKKHYTFG